MSSFSHSHCQKNSGELDVFEATRYFSGSTKDEPGSRRPVKAEIKSLDMPIEARTANHIKDKIKCKQPRSPGGKLAVFLNSFFRQYSASKKKKASKLVKCEEESIAWTRKRRSSMSNTQGKSDYDTKSSHNPSSCSNVFGNPSVHYAKRDDQRFKNEIGGNEFRSKMRLEDKSSLSKDQGKEEGESEGSDSSSDLFELTNYDFGEVSSGLRVYGSTCTGVIKRGA